MIGLSDLKNALGNYGGYTTVNLLSDIRKHINWFLGAPDNVSGIEIGDKEYPLIVGNDGCWWYITDEGCKVKATDSEGKFIGKVINANEKFLKDFGGCYDTGNGDVQIEGWVSLNDLHEVRRGELYVILSTDPAYPPGTKLMSFKEEIIPEGWKEIACRFPDMTKRLPRYFDACYSLPGNSTSGEPTHEIQIKGYEILDYNLSYKPLGKDDQYLSHTEYYVANQVGTEYAIGDRIDSIPDEWVERVCRFPDLTQRHVDTEEFCYRTENGLLVRVRGQERWNNWDWTRVVNYIIIYSDDPAYPVDIIITNVPDGWINIKCYDADDTLRHQMSFIKCVKINGKRVKLETFRIINNKFNVDRSLYIVKQSDDTANYPVNMEFFELPDGHEDVDCDLPDLADRDPIRVHECYATKFNDDGTVSGKIEIVGWETVDAFGDIESNNYTVINSTDINYPVNHIFNTPVPTSFRKIDCDFPDSEARDTEIIKEDCYQTPNGVIQVTGTMTYEQKTGSSSATLWAVSLQVIRSTDPDISTGQILNITTFDQTWIKITCMFPNMTERHIEHTIRCYTTPGGTVKIINYIIYNNTLTPELSRVIVINSTDDNFPLDTHMDAIPNDWALMVCDFPNMEERHLEGNIECYKLAARPSTQNREIRIKVKSFEIYDNTLNKDITKYVVLDSTGYGQFMIGYIMDELPENCERVVCDLSDASQRYVSQQTYCYTHRDTGKRIKILAIRTYKLQNREQGDLVDSYNGGMQMEAENIVGVVIWSDDDTIHSGRNILRVQELDSWQNGDVSSLDIPEGFVISNCTMPNLEQRYLDVVPEGTYKIGNSETKVTITKRHIVDHEFGSDKIIYTIDNSTDLVNYPIGKVIDAIPNDWVQVKDDILDMTVSHSMSLRGCYGNVANTEKIYVEGILLMDMYLTEIRRKMNVVQSSSAAYPVGTTLTSVPNGWNEVQCNCNCQA